MSEAPMREANAMPGREDALLPCPFCGSEAKVLTARVSEDCEEARVECTSCAAVGPADEGAYANHAAAASYWNRRTPVPAPQPDMERVLQIGGRYGAPVWIREGEETKWAWRKVTSEETEVMRAALNRAALPAQERTWQQPEGWKLVPVEPTPEVLEAALDESGNRVTAYIAPRESGVATECDLSEEDAASINRDLKRAYGEMYEAMLEVSPPAPPHVAENRHGET